MTTRAKLERLLNDLGLKVAVLEPQQGYTVDAYPLRGQLKEADASKFNADMAGRLKSPVRVAYNDGGILAVELAAQTRKTVSLGDCGSPPADYALPILLGKTNQGKALWLDLADAPHLLGSGTTGSGKSNWLLAALTMLLGHTPPSKLELIAIDPKKVELSSLSNSPHLIAPVITEALKAQQVIAWLVLEMSRRYEELAKHQLNNIRQTNMPRIILVVEELAQLLGSGDKDNIEGNLQQLTQLGRAAGIHIILLTQKPSAAVFSTTIKANVPRRVAFKALNHHESIAILEQSGSQDLLGKGDGLLLADNGQLTRFQAPLFDPDELKPALKKFESEPNGHRVLMVDDAPKVAEASEVLEDDTINQAQALVAEHGKLTAAMLTEHGVCGKNKASSVMKRLRDMGIILDHDARVGYSPARVA